MTEVIVKLVSGEEIFASLEKVDEEKLFLSKPMKIAKRYIEDSNGLNIRLNYEPFLDFGLRVEVFIPIRHEHVMYCEPLNPHLVKLYRDMVEVSSEIIHEPSKSEAVTSGSITLH